MPLPLNEGQAGRPPPDEQALLHDAAARGRRLLDELIRHRSGLAGFADDATAEGAAALERTIEAAARLVRDLSVGDGGGGAPADPERTNDDDDDKREET